MTDHGMLFVDSLARSILQGRKVVTRRPMLTTNTLDLVALLWSIDHGEEPSAIDCRIKPGDRLWVREAWRVIPDCTNPGEAMVVYRAGAPGRLCKLPEDVDAAELSKWSRLSKNGQPRWTPSLLMPRWAARTVREVVSVHAERLGPLTPEQALEEGFGSPAEFQNAWDAIYRAKGKTMASRPWVWVTRFVGPGE